MMMRSVSYTFAVVLVIGLQCGDADAGGLLKKLFGKRNCGSTTTCCQPVQSSCQPSCTASCPASCTPASSCAPSPGSPAPCATVQAPMATPCSSCSTPPHDCGGPMCSMLCFQDPGLPPGSGRVRCKLQYLRDITCCNTRHCNDPTIRAACKNAAMARYRHCMGLPSCRKALTICTGCQEGQTYCGCGHDDWACQYNCLRLLCSRKLQLSRCDHSRMFIHSHRYIKRCHRQGRRDSDGTPSRVLCR